MINTGTAIAIVLGVLVLATGTALVVVIRRNRSKAVAPDGKLTYDQATTLGELQRLIKAVNEDDLGEVEELRDEKWGVFIGSLPGSHPSQLYSARHQALYRATVLEEYNSQITALRAAWEAFETSIDQSPTDRLALLNAYAKSMYALMPENRNRVATEFGHLDNNLGPQANPIIGAMFEEYLGLARAGDRNGYLQARQLMADVAQARWSRHGRTPDHRFGMIDGFDKLQYPDDWDELTVKFIAVVGLDQFVKPELPRLVMVLVLYAKAVRDGDMLTIKLLLAHYATNRAIRDVLGENNANHLAQLMLDDAEAKGLPLDEE